MPKAQTAYIHNAMYSCGLPLRTDPPFMYTKVFSCPHIRTSTAVCSRIVHLKKFRSPCSYIANNNTTLMNGQTKREETIILLHIYSSLKIPNSSSNVNKKPFEITLKPILYSGSFSKSLLRHICFITFVYV